MPAIEQCGNPNSAYELLREYKVEIREVAVAISLDYIKAAMAGAEFDPWKMGRFFATIPKFEGLWAVGRTPDEARKELCSALKGWLRVHTEISKELPPQIEGVNLAPDPKVTRV